MIKAIVFDCFGVLVSEGVGAFFDERFGNDSRLMHEAVTLTNQLNLGQLGYDDFIAKIAAMSGVDSGSLRERFEHNVPNRELFAYIAELKPYYKLGMLSNTTMDWITRIFDQEQTGLFDAIVVSGQTGFVKPDRRAYEAVAAKLGLGVQECVLVDDQLRYIEGAKSAGMPVILYQDLDQMKRELEGMLVKQ